MAWIEIVPSNRWEPGMAASLEDPKTGNIDNIMRIHSLNPRGMAAHDAIYTSAMSGTSTMRKADRELVAMVVSQLNDCHY